MPSKKTETTMKVLKYLAALLLIFSTNVCLTSCGDDDEPTPAVDPKDYPQHEFFCVGGIGYKSISGADVEVTRLNSLTAPDEYTGDVVIPSTVTYQGYTYNVVSIGERAFKGCTRINSVTMPESVTKIGKNAFQETSLQSITIGANVREICEEAFIYNVVLKTVVISDRVEKIGSKAFFASTVENISFGRNLKEIGNAAFYDCDKLTRVRLSDSVSKIGDYAFQSCNELYSITLGESTARIGFKAFANCPKLKYVMCKAESVPVAASNAFSDDPIDELRVPGFAIDFYMALPPWKFFAKFGPIDE